MNTFVCDCFLIPLGYGVFQCHKPVADSMHTSLATFLLFLLCFSSHRPTGIDWIHANRRPGRHRSFGLH